MDALLNESGETGNARDSSRIGGSLGKRATSCLQAYGRQLDRKWILVEFCSSRKH